MSPLQRLVPNMSEHMTKCVLWQNDTLLNDKMCFSSFSFCEPLLQKMIEDKSQSLWRNHWLNKNLKTHFAWYLQKESVSWSIDKILNTENLHGKKHAENMPKKLVPDPFWILANSSKQSMYARNSFENEIFWMRIINLTWF